MDADLLQSIEVAQEIFPFRRRGVLAQQIVEQLLDGKVKADPSKMSRNSWDDAAKRIREVIYGDEWYATLG